MKRLLVLCVALATAACSERSVTRYAGSVMSEAAPDSAGSLRLTFYSRTDSSLSGVIQLGAPAHGTGTAYAWFEGRELNIYTIGSRSGDTIHWISTLADTALGGRYEVTGGRRSGQQGTWRARLVAGPPAIPATLHSPLPPPLPAVTSLWPLLLLLTLALAFGRWILRAPRVAEDASATPSLPPRSGRRRIGGWLVVFVVGQAITLLLWFDGAAGSWSGYTRTLGSAAVFTGMRPLIVLETAMFMLSLPIVLGGLILLLRRSPCTPRYWLSYHVTSGAYVLADIGAMAMIRPQMARLYGDPALSSAAMSNATTRQLGTVIAALVWSLYWIRSRRVRATFGAGALDREAVPWPTAADAGVAQSVRAPSGWTRWRRILARGAAVVLVGAAAVVAIALWSTRVSRYSVPADTDIRTVVAGRWAWTSDSAGCRTAHTIAFSDRGKVMTITSGDIGAPSPTVYDILGVSRSSIRGAIRGERRLTDDRKPVIWDLVLTGPDEYRWQRTDWARTPWNYTAAIRRCPVAASTTGRGSQTHR